MNDNSWNKTSKKSASFYRPAPLQTDSGYWVKDYFIAGKLQYQALSQDPEKEDYVGTATWYDEKGKITGTKQYRQILKEGELKEYFKNGELRSLSHFKNWRLTDTSYLYYNDGILRAKYTWQDGKLNGPFTTYHENGSTYQRAFFTNNLLDKTFETYYWPGAGYKSREEMPAETKDRLESRMTFSNGIIHGPATEWTPAGEKTYDFQFEDNKPTGHSLYIRSNGDTAIYFTFKDGSLTGRFIEHNGESHREGFFDMGKTISWQVKYKGKLMTEGKALNDSIVAWKYYSRWDDYADQPALVSTGYSNNDQWYGDWNFSTRGGEKISSISVFKTDPAMIHPRLLQGMLKIDMPVFFEDISFNYKVIDAIKANKIVTATYTAFDNKGKPVIKGYYANGGQTGKWTYVNQRRQSLVLDAEKQWSANQVLAFVEVRRASPHDNLILSDHPLPPELVLATKGDDDADYRFSTGELVRTAYRKDKNFVDQLISKIISTLKLKNDAAQRKIINREFQMEINMPEIREAVDESVNTIFSRVPILLKKEN